MIRLVFEFFQGHFTDSLLGCHAFQVDDVQLVLEVSYHFFTFFAVQFHFFSSASFLTLFTLLGKPPISVPEK